jgi:hypothetical protein
MPCDPGTTPLFERLTLTGSQICRFLCATPWPSDRCANRRGWRDECEARDSRLDRYRRVPLLDDVIFSRKVSTDGANEAQIVAATIIEALMPNYALGQQVSRTDDRIRATYETVPSPQGNESFKGYLVRPVTGDTRAATPARLPGILVVHENRGLNFHTRTSRRFALANFMAFAPDGLTSGGFPGDDYKGGQMFSRVDAKKMTEEMVILAIATRGCGACIRWRSSLKDADSGSILDW